MGTVEKNGCGMGGTGHGQTADPNGILGSLGLSFPSSQRLCLEY